MHILSSLLVQSPIGLFMWIMDYLNKLDHFLTQNLDDGSNPAKILDSALYNLKPWQIVTLSLISWISLRLFIKSLICIKS